MSTNQKRVPPITIEGARLIYRNFSGTAKKFNAKGLRNFHVVLDEKLAQMLRNDGWNVKVKPSKEEGDPPLISLKVWVRFDNYPPRVVLVTKTGKKRMLDEDSVSVLDFAEISNADIVISPSRWNQPDGSTGIKAYLSKMFVTLSENDLESKYSDLPTAGRDADEDDD